jgi:hypothetical protein
MSGGLERHRPSHGAAPLICLPFCWEPEEGMAGQQKRLVIRLLHSRFVHLECAKSTICITPYTSNFVDF